MSECLICTQEIPEVSSVFVAPCGHGPFCTECLQEYIHHKVQIKLHSGTITCPTYPACTVALDDECVLRIIAENSEDDREKYLRWKTMAEDAKANDGTIREIMVDDSLAEFLKGTKPCPNQSCREPLEKTEGCDHIRCPVCGTDMCYRCGNACSSGKYVRRCDHCSRGYVDHQHGPRVRLFALFSFVCWLPFALAYSLFCLACTPFCYCLLVQVDHDQQEALEKGNHALAPKPSLDVVVENTALDLPHEQTLAANACKRVTKQLCALIVMPFIAVGQFAGCCSCACLMPTEEELEAMEALDKMERAKGNPLRTND